MPSDSRQLLTHKEREGLSEEDLPALERLESLYANLNHAYYLTRRVALGAARRMVTASGSRTSRGDAFQMDPYFVQAIVWLESALTDVGLILKEKP